MIEQAINAVAVSNCQSLNFAITNDAILIKVLNNLLIQAPKDEIQAILDLIEATIKALELRNEAMTITLGQMKAKD